jgi:hypothetical protein
LNLAFDRADPPPERLAGWRTAFLLGLAAAGLLWGLAGWLYFASAQMIPRLLTLPKKKRLDDELDAIARSRPNTRVRYLVGNRRSYPINAKSLTHLIPDFHTADVYTCGPAELVASVRHAAEVVGIPEQRIHDEAFSFHSPDTYGNVKTKTRTTTQEKKSR